MIFFQKIFCPKLFKENLKLKKEIGVDFLTNLKNRKSYDDEIKILFQREKKTKNIYHIFIDVDNFKTINDTLGHNIGDKVLQDIAKIFIDNLRSTDGVFRIAGDEFVFLLQRIEPEKLKEKLNYLNKLVKDIAPRGIDLSLSIGVYKIDFEKDTEISVLEKADELMYKSKHKGGNKIIFWDEI